MCRCAGVPGVSPDLSRFMIASSGSLLWGTGGGVLGSLACLPICLPICLPSFAVFASGERGCAGVRPGVSPDPSYSPLVNKFTVGVLDLC